MGSMCSKEGMSIFMGKPGRYRFPLLGSREAEGQKPVRGTCSPFPLSPPLSPPRESPGLCSLQAPPLPSPLLSARLLGPFPPILLQTLELNCICQDYDSQAAQPSPHSRPFTSCPSSFFPNSQSTLTCHLGLHKALSWSRQISYLTPSPQSC